MTTMSVDEFVIWAKREIVHRAHVAGHRFDPGNVAHVRDHDCDVVWLRHIDQPFYHSGPNGGYQILSSTTPVMHVVYGGEPLAANESGRARLLLPPPKLVVLIPYLIFVRAEDGTIQGELNWPNTAHEPS
jgi:hypothetical protein